MFYSQNSRTVSFFKKKIPGFPRIYLIWFLIFSFIIRSWGRDGERVRLKSKIFVKTGKWYNRYNTINSIIIPSLFIAHLVASLVQHWVGHDIKLTLYALYMLPILCFTVPSEDQMIMKYCKRIWKCLAKVANWPVANLSSRELSITLIETWL